MVRRGCAYSKPYNRASHNSRMEWWCPSIAWMKEQRSDGDRSLVELGVIRASMVHAASVLPAGRVGRSSPSLG